MDAIEKTLLEQIAGLHEIPTGAYNIRKNGETESRNVTANIDIVSKSDGSGIEIHVKPGTRHESVHVPVILSQSGLNEVVYNDFYIGEGADVVIIAGCGIHNSGCDNSRHDGIHLHVRLRCPFRFQAEHLRHFLHIISIIIRWKPHNAILGGIPHGQCRQVPRHESRRSRCYVDFPAVGKGQVRIRVENIKFHAIACLRGKHTNKTPNRRTGGSYNVRSRLAQNTA